MEIIDGILYGFSVSFQPLNLFLCLIGVLIGTLVGVLPGLGPVASISLLLPITFRISSPVSALIMLSGIY
jgi:putative tricarboxylic transport membrane protein